LNEGIYWAVVTMTTVGYGDKTPKTPVGRFIAVLWMLGSLALISLLSTSLVSRMTADRVEAGPIARTSDLENKRLAAVADSSGAEYLDDLRLRYTRYSNLQEALTSLASGRSDAVVNSVGALQYSISERFSGVIPMPRGLLAPAYMAFALPPNSPLRKPLDPGPDQGHGKRRVAFAGGELFREIGTARLPLHRRQRLWSDPWAGHEQRPKARSVLANHQTANRPLKQRVRTVFMRQRAWILL